MCVWGLDTVLITATGWDVGGAPLKASLAGGQLPQKAVRGPLIYSLFVLPEEGARREP